MIFHETISRLKSSTFDGMTMCGKISSFKKMVILNGSADLN
jgi:hypothetical protein